MLDFYQAFRRYDIPKKVKGEIYDTEGKALEQISNFNKINIFVGPNNSGKSMIIRELLREGSEHYYDEEEWSAILSFLKFYDRIFERMTDSFRMLNTGYERILNANTNTPIFSKAEILSQYEIFKQYKGNYDVQAVISHLGGCFDRPFELRQDSTYILTGKGMNQVNLSPSQHSKIIESFLGALRELKEEAAVVIDNLKKYVLNQGGYENSRIYIPAVRTLRPFAKIANIENATRGEYGFAPTIKIYNGQEFATTVFSMLNAPYGQRGIIERFEDFLSEEFFESKKVDLTFDNDKQVLLIKIGDEQERPIYELGDGLQMIIILTFPFFSNKGGTIAIEEPELFIHPGLQKTFLKFLISNEITRNFQVLLATHSNHIIDSINSASNVSIFSVKKKIKDNDKEIEKVPDFVIDNLAHGDENLLNLLGITATSVYLSNCTIWVEGITDKIYIQKYIQEYLSQPDLNATYKICKEFKEGINYSFAITGGDNIIHWDFEDNSEYAEQSDHIIVRKFCSKSMVIVDNDFSKNPVRKQYLSDTLGCRFIELAVPEIENLLPGDVIRDTLLLYPSVAKSVGSNSLEPVSAWDLSSLRIGELIDNKLLSSYSGVKKFSKGSGRLKRGDKLDFCIKSCKFITHNKMSAEAVALVEKLLDFIMTKN